MPQQQELAHRRRSCHFPRRLSCPFRSRLAASDLPVGSIGYRCGYSNNASFTRAFSRRYGIAPTRLRALEVAA